MPITHNPLGSADCRDFMDRALTAERGVKLIFGQAGEKACETCGNIPQAKGFAINFRQRCMGVRAQAQKLNTKVYGKDDPIAGTSIYDELVISVVAEPDGRWSVIAMKSLEGRIAHGVIFEEL